jgi:hypothetical protein
MSRLLLSLALPLAAADQNHEISDPRTDRRTVADNGGGAGRGPFPRKRLARDNLAHSDRYP